MIPVPLDDGVISTGKVCNAFIVNYDYGEVIIQRLPRNTTITYGGVGCAIGDDVDNDLLSLLCFNPDLTSFTI